MLRETVTIEEVLTLLNEIVQDDPETARALVETRVPCNASIQAHPTIQVSMKDNEAVVGLLGVLNGLFGVDERGYGPITAEFADSGEVIRFCRTERHAVPTT